MFLYKVKKNQLKFCSPLFILILIIFTGHFLNAQEVVSNQAKVHQSSTYGQSVASRAVDGNKKANDHTISRTHLEDNPWLEIDLGMNFNVSKIKVWHLSSDKLEFYIKEKIEDEFEKVEGLKSSNAGGGKYLYGLRIPKRKRKTGRYVRIVYPASQVSLAITEVQVIGDPVADGISTSEELLAEIKGKNEDIKDEKKEVKRTRRKEFMGALANSAARSTGQALEEGAKKKVQSYAEKRTAVPVAPSLLSHDILPRTCGVNKTHLWSFDWSDVKGATEYEIMVSLYENSNVLNQTKVISSEHAFPVNGLKNNFDLANSVYWKVRSLVNGKWSAWGRSTRSVEPCEIDEEPLATFESGIDVGSTFVSPIANQEMANACDGSTTSWQFEWEPVPGAEMYKLSLEGVTIDRISYETNQTFKAIQVPNQSAVNITNPKAYIAVMINGQWSSSIGSVPFKVKSCPAEKVAPVRAAPPSLTAIPGYLSSNCKQSYVDWQFKIKPISGATDYIATLTSNHGRVDRWRGSGTHVKFNFQNKKLKGKSNFRLIIEAEVRGKWTDKTTYNLSVEKCQDRSTTSSTTSNSNTIIEAERKILRDYTVEVKTQDKSGAGTDSNIYLTLHFGGGKSSEEFVLNPLISGNAFESGHVNRFMAKVKSYSGVPKSITVRSDGKHAGSAWDLAYIMIGYKKFICNCEIDKGSKVLR